MSVSAYQDKEALQVRLREVAARFAKTNENLLTPVPGLSIYHRCEPTAPLPCTYGPGLAITVQGQKQVMLGEDVIDYGPGQSLVTTVDLPVVSHVTRASIQEPYTGIGLDLDVSLVTQVAAEIEMAEPLRETSRAISVADLDPALLDAVIRLISLIDEPRLMLQLSILIQREIILRLLTGPHGLYLWQLVSAGSPGKQIARSVTWLKLNFRKNFPVDELARSAHMSPSTFRQHFRTVTGMSPLQYQKKLRLQEARQLMLNENHEAGTAALLVGYESQSQFNREYARIFGEPPLRDIKRLRQEGLMEKKMPRTAG